MLKCTCMFYRVLWFILKNQNPFQFPLKLDIWHVRTCSTEMAKLRYIYRLCSFSFFVVFLSYAGLQNRSRLFYTTQALFSFPVMFGLLGIFMLRKFAGKFTAQLCRSSNGSNCPKCYPKDLRKYTHTRKTIENSQDKFGICSFAEVSPSCKRI